MAGEPIELHAEYHPLEKKISGRLSPNLEEWTDSLISLESPTEQWMMERSFPFGIESGNVQIRHNELGVLFESQLPRRWDLSGVDGSSLFMDGLWHPEIKEHKEVDWNVSVSTSDDKWIVLNGQIAQDKVSWSGQSHTHSLSILPKAYIYNSKGITLISANESIKKLHRLETCIPDFPDTTFVVAPMGHELVRVGTEQIWLGEHTLEGDFGLWKTHCESIKRSLIELHSEEPEEWYRKLEAYIKVYPSSSLEESLHNIQWLPEVNNILYSGRLPYYSDIFQLEPPIQLSFTGTKNQHHPRFISRQINSILTEDEWNTLLKSPLPLSQSLIHLGITQSQLDIWKGPTVIQNFKIQSSKDSKWVVRESTPQAPPQALPIQIDDTSPTLYYFQSGPGRLELHGERFHLDPSQSVPQTSTRDDTFPQKWSKTAYLFPSAINTRTWRPSVYGLLNLRPHPTHPVRLITSASSTPLSLLSIEQSLYYGMGPIQDGRARPINTWVSFGAVFPDFDTPILYGAEIGVAKDTRSSWQFPRNGTRAYFSTGLMTDRNQNWNYTHTSLTDIRPLHRRIIEVTRLHYSQTGSPYLSTQLPIGGIKNVAGHSIDFERGNKRLGVNTELRILAMRNANIHLPLVRWTDLIVHMGYDTATLLAPKDPWAKGFAMGLSAIGDVLHVRPGYIGATMGLSQGEVQQFYIHGGHRF